MRHTMARGGLWLGLVVALGAGCGEDKPPVEAGPRVPDTRREWPRELISQGVGTLAAPGPVVPAGGVIGGGWALSPTGTELAHVGGRTEENVLRVWNLRQGAWARYLPLPEALVAAAWNVQGDTLAVAGPSGRLWVLGPRGEPARVEAGPCRGIAAVAQVGEGWVVAGEQGCLARYLSGSWTQAPDTGIQQPLALSVLQRGGVVAAGAGVGGVVASVWWPEGAPRPTTLADSVQPEGAPTSTLVHLALGGAVQPSWAVLSPTGSGPVFVAAEGQPLRAWDPTTGEPVTEPIPTERWAGAAGAAVSADGLRYALLRRDGALEYGSAGSWDVIWSTSMPEPGPSPRILGTTGRHLALVGAGTPRVLDVESFDLAPSPPDQRARPWPPLQIGFGAGGKALAATYASPGLGSTSRNLVLWTPDMEYPRRIELGSIRDERPWEEMLITGQPVSSLAVSPRGEAFAAQGAREVQLVEAATGIRAGAVANEAGGAVAFTGNPDEMLVVRSDGVVMKAVVATDVAQEIMARYDAPVVGMAASYEGGTLAMAYGAGEQGGVEVMFPTTRRVVGRASVPGVPANVTIDSTGNRVLLALPGKGIFQWPGGRAVVKRGGEGAFTAVEFHPRQGMALYSGSDYSLQALEGGRSRRVAVTGGQIRDIAYHPGGSCYALALAGGRIEIWGKGGMALAMEMWEGGQWVVWTHEGKARGDVERTRALRVPQEEAALAPPLPASADDIAAVWRQACGR